MQCLLPFPPQSQHLLSQVALLEILAQLSPSQWGLTHPVVITLSYFPAWLLTVLSLAHLQHNKGECSISVVTVSPEPEECLRRGGCSVFTEGTVYNSAIQMKIWRLPGDRR